MKKLLFYVSVSLSVVCMLDSCKKEKNPELYQPVDENGMANCYIVSGAGKYHFSAVKGNSSEAVGTVATVEVLWETFGTSATPKKGDLIAEVSYDNATNAVRFTTAAEFRKGNALIAAKDATDKILWSWHIWMTDKPEDQVYNNGAGTMLDRNLGATSATPGDVGALGLLYQWGRKDPFMGASDIAEGTTTLAASTIGTWPDPVVSDKAKGTIDYAVSNPVTFILGNKNNDDWYYTGSEGIDNSRWKSSKTIFDPCPPGYRVPDGGGFNGVWAIAFGKRENSSFEDEGGFDSANKGFNFGSSGKGSAKLSNSASTCWYPAAGGRRYDGSMAVVGKYGYYWTSSISNDYGNGINFHFNNKGDIFLNSALDCAYALAVRCMKEQ